LRLADEAADATASGVSADRLKRLADFLRLSENTEDDDVEHALRRRLAAALSDAIGGKVAPIRD
jgi:hypothetical protein